MTLQAPSSVIMVRPHAFQSNPETRADNAFQTALPLTEDDVAALARDEFDAAVARLRKAGVTVHVFEDTGNETPDSVFPNNWFSTHAGGHVAVYPMFAANRRRERRWDVIDLLKRDYRVQDVIDYSGLEADDLALEGTGAMVLDHAERVAYVARSKRADPVLLERFCTHFGFEPIVFDAVDASGAPIYHTNVLMTIGTAYALVGLNLIANETRRATVAARLAEAGRDVIDLSADQIANFAGNAIELTGRDGPVLVLSARALASLHDDQINLISRSASLLPLDLPTIETAGGSARCMIAGVHLARR
ncbi:citrulline utilization hydrolase CtlX [Sedimentitalea todarodis]|uniref:Arginine deiminase-related protein n=1 Tax=Sedimentitalea todarodis TaxID=1631240 RepID=A0ABU3VC13_9RHOB|nr:arginine deiminase-related protein [Sedimentitalea todarodis]MDU9003728.1 arginine deiminase-related protein [Sedimentitalea todarodis]